MKHFNFYDLKSKRYYLDEINSIVAILDLENGTYTCDFDSFNGLKLSSKLYLLEDLRSKSLQILIGELKYVS